MDSFGQVLWECVLFEGVYLWEGLVALKRTEFDVEAGRKPQALSPRIRLANWMSLGMMVTRLAWMAHKLASSNNPTR